MLRLALLFTAIASPLWAYCPTKADLEGRGIVFEKEGGGFEHHRAEKPGWIGIFDQDPNGDAAVMTAFHGIYLKDWAPVVNGKVQLDKLEEYATEAELQRLGAPKPDNLVEDEVLDGQIAISTSRFYFELGDCTYLAIPLLLGEPGAWLHERFVYIPDLGTALITEYLDGDFVESYRYLRARRY